MGKNQMIGFMKGTRRDAGPLRFYLFLLVATLCKSAKASPFLPFLHAMHEVTPSAVAMADSILMAVWIVNFQNVLFFMVQNFNV
jgi:hypothetical protein